MKRKLGSVIEHSPGILKVSGSNPTQSIAITLIYGNVKGSLRIIEMLSYFETDKSYGVKNLCINILFISICLRVIS